MNKRHAPIEALGTAHFGPADDPAVLMQELLLASQMRMLDRLHADMAHQLRGPMNAMTLTAALLENTLSNAKPDPQLQTKQLRYVDIFQQELRRLNAGLDQTMSELSGVVWQPPELLDLAQLVRTGAQQLSHMLNKKRLICNVDAVQGKYLIKVRSAAMRIVFFNLCVHLLNAAVEGDTLTFTFQLQQAEGVENTKHLLDVSIQNPHSQDDVAILHTRQQSHEKNRSLLPAPFSNEVDLWLGRQLMSEVNGCVNELFLAKPGKSGLGVLRGYRYEFCLDDVSAS